MKTLVGYDIVARSFTPGIEELLRVRQGSELPVEVTVRGPLTEATLHVEERLGARVEETQIPMAAEHDFFRAVVRCTQAGVLRFRVRYCRDGVWYWDHVPYCYLMVDPDHLDRLRMYTLVPNASGTIRAWIEKLPHIAGMGFNTVHLLPITLMGRSESPYAAHDLFTIDPRYLDPDDRRSGHDQFASFVDALSQHGLSLCVDLVLNHVGVDSEITEQHLDWLAEDRHEDDGIKRAGWQGTEVFHRWQDLALLDYEPFDSRSGTRLWMTMLRYALYWSDFAAKTDGVLRLDNLHSSHRPFMRWAMGRIRKRYPNLVVLAELFTDAAHMMMLRRELGLHLILATQWEHKFVPQLRDYLRYVHETARRVLHFFPISSHDSGVPAREYGDVRSTAPRLVVSALLGPGPTGIVQGVEHGVLEPVRFIGSASTVEVTPDINFAPLIRRLFELVDAQPALAVAGNLTFFDANHEAILAGARSNPETGRAEVLICVNLDINAPRVLACDLTSVVPEGAAFLEIDSGETLLSGSVSIELAAGGHRIYVRNSV